MKELGHLLQEGQVSELLILSDGTVFGHNLTPTMAGLLAELNPTDNFMRRRAASMDGEKTVSLSPHPEYSRS